MKKTSVRILCAVLVLCTLLPALAETLPVLSGYTDAQILELAEALDREIVSRGIERTAHVPAGTYIAGRDLPAGRYLFRGAAQGDDWGNMTVYSMKDGKRDKQKEWEIVSADDPSECVILLEEGDELKCAVPFELTVSSGIHFF